MFLICHYKTLGQIGLRWKSNSILLFVISHKYFPRMPAYLLYISIYNRYADSFQSFYCNST